MNSVEFETALFRMRQEHYRYREVDPITEGFRPIGGMLGDFCAIEHECRYHFFAIERRLHEGTPFYPGHEIFFCHASTADFRKWEVHDPVLGTRTCTWEEAHVWAPFVLRHEGRYVMAYTGVNRYGSQDIGLAFSDNLFDWEPWSDNPISPADKRAWAFWRRDGIASCRDPHMLVHDGRIYMTYTTNTRDGASSIALTSTTNWTEWEDYGPILTGPATGYEPFLAGGHPQGQLESSNLFRKQGKWLLLIQESRRGTGVKNWIYESEDMHHFEYASGREFWPGAYTVEVLEDRDERSFLACTGTIRFGIVNWADERPIAQFFTSYEALDAWRPGSPVQRESE
jgi:arabinan endo-1,5-alpha-L-arabinosidase